jgi:hypothetical protein
MIPLIEAMIESASAFSSRPLCTIYSPIDYSFVVDLQNNKSVLVYIKTLNKQQ